MGKDKNNAGWDEGTRETCNFKQDDQGRYWAKELRKS